MDFMKIQVSAKSKRRYERAQKKLEEPPFEKENYPVFIVAKIFTYGYHALSLCLALLAIAGLCYYMTGFENTFVGLISVVSIGIFASGAMFLIEALRMKIYNKTARRKVNGTLKPVLIFGSFAMLIVSTIVSGFGGYFYQNEMQDKSEVITEEHKITIDSIKGVYVPRIILLQETLQEQSEVLNTTKNIKLREKTNASLDKTQYSIRMQDSIMRAEIAHARMQKVDAYGANADSKYKMSMYVACGVILLEVLAFMFYLVEYWYHKGCEDEKNALTQHMPTKAHVRKPAITASNTQKQQGQAKQEHVQNDVQHTQKHIKEHATDIAIGRKKTTRMHKYPEMCKQLKEYVGASLPNEIARKLASEYGTSQDTVRRTKGELDIYYGKNKS